jgi:mycothiol S-conjugate amidase
MTQQSMTILTIFAHPDDEIGVGSTLGRYSDAGIHTVLVCASRGEVATIFCDDCATRENLAEVRTRELECACDHIGIRELRWLDWPDGGIKNLPREEAIREIVRQIREIKPQVIITHPEHGLYPHPDHLAVWEITRVAFDAAGDPAAYPEAGPAWTPARLFTRALSQSIFDRSPGLADFRVELNGELLPFFATPDDEIDVTMRVGAWVPRRMAAWSCHVSQHNPKGFSQTMPDGVREEMAANEQFLLAAAVVPLPAGVDDDLLAGLWTAAPAEPVTIEAAEAPEPGPVADLLRGELATQLALAELAKLYLATVGEQKYAAPLRHLADAINEVTYRLARGLRVWGLPPGGVHADEALRRRGGRVELPEERIRFLRSAAQAAMTRMQTHAAEAATPDERGLWDDVLPHAQAALDVLAAVAV